MSHTKDNPQKLRSSRTNKVPVRQQKDTLRSVELMLPRVVERGRRISSLDRRMRRSSVELDKLQKYMGRSDDLMEKMEKMRQEELELLLGHRTNEATITKAQHNDILLPTLPQF